MRLLTALLLLSFSLNLKSAQPAAKENTEKSIIFYTPEVPKDRKRGVNAFGEYLVSGTVLSGAHTEYVKYVPNPAGTLTVPCADLRMLTKLNFTYLSKLYGTEKVAAFDEEEYELRLDPKTLKEGDIYIDKTSERELYAIIIGEGAQRKAIAAELAKQKKAADEAELKRVVEEQERVDARLHKSPNPRKLAEAFIYRYQEKKAKYEQRAQNKPFKFLGISKDSSKKQVRDAVRSFAVIWHPDKWINDANQATALEISMLIGQAGAAAEAQAQDK